MTKKEQIFTFKKLKSVIFPVIPLIVSVLIETGLGDDSVL